MPDLDSEKTKLTDEGQTVETDLTGIDENKDPWETVAGGELGDDDKETTPDDSKKEDSTVDKKTDKKTDDTDTGSDAEKSSKFMQTAFQKAHARLKEIDPAAAKEVSADIRKSTGKEISPETATAKTDGEKTIGQMTMKELNVELDDRMAGQRQQNAVAQQRVHAMETVAAFAEEVKVDEATLRQVAEEVRKDFNVDLDQPGHSRMWAGLVINHLRDHTTTQGTQTVADRAAADAADQARSLAATTQPGKAASPAPVRKSKAENMLDNLFAAGPPSSLTRLDSFRNKK